VQSLSVTITTASLLNGTTATGTFTVGKAGFFEYVTADAPCWVRLYGTDAARAADASRVQTVDPISGHGVYADDLPGVAGAALSFPLSPPQAYRNNDTPRTSTLYYSIRNLSGITRTITVTFDLLILEQ
jgi:hypothetical protein